MWCIIDKKLGAVLYLENRASNVRKVNVMEVMKMYLYNGFDKVDKWGEGKFEDVCIWKKKILIYI